jgi:hypothetical protein
MWQISRDTAEENDIPVFKTEESIKLMSVLKQKENKLFNYKDFTHKKGLWRRMGISVTNSLLFLSCFEMFLHVLANLFIRSSAVPYKKPNVFGYDESFQILSGILRW